MVKSAYLQSPSNELLTFSFYYTKPASYYNHGQINFRLDLDLD